MESPPDIHPVKNGLFKVNTSPQEGSSYVGLVAREDGTTESLGQSLTNSIKKGQCYQLSIWLSKSDHLTAIQRRTRKMVDFNKPMVLKVWGGVSPCGKKSLLAVSPPIDHPDWQEYVFRFQSDESLNWVSFEASYSHSNMEAYNGHLLLDNASAIIPINCHTADPLVDIADVKPPPYHYFKYSVPESINTDPSLFHKNNLYVQRDFRLVEKKEALHEIVEEHCATFGFEEQSDQLIDATCIGLFEIGANLRKFKNQRLQIGLPAKDPKLFKKRTKLLHRVFKEIDVNRHQYQILPIYHQKKWMCASEEFQLILAAHTLEN